MNSVKPQCDKPKKLLQGDAMDPASGDCPAFQSHDMDELIFALVVLIFMQQGHITFVLEIGYITKQNKELFAKLIYTFVSSTDNIGIFFETL